jgi:hypothetical protein
LANVKSIRQRSILARSIFDSRGAVVIL